MGLGASADGHNLEAQSNERPSTAHFPPLTPSSSWTVQTSFGYVRGGKLGGIGVFLGVPYARPPIGDLRWAAPQVPEPWGGVLECTRCGPCSPQLRAPDGRPRPPDIPDASATGEPEDLPPGMDEDCLQVNIHTPGLTGRRPVFVWIHGGNLTGGCSWDGFAVDPSARRGNNPLFLSKDYDLVVVTVTYRLNVFGFLNLEGGAGNCGLLDSVAALRWVRDEIHRFGGDPENVTICGLSAGGHICNQLLSVPSAKGLFHKAICMSGSAAWTLSCPEEHKRRVAEPFARALGFDSLSDMTIERARQVPAEIVRQAFISSRWFLESGTLNVDGDTVPSDPLDLMLGGCAAGVPVLIGVTRDEGVFSTRLRQRGASPKDLEGEVTNHLRSAYYLTPWDLDALRVTEAEAIDSMAKGLIRDYKDLAARYSSAPPEIRERFVNLANDKCPELADEAYELSVKMLGDHDFTVPHILAAWALARHSPVYAYVFSDETVPGSRFAGHGGDERFVFGTQDMREPDATSMLTSALATEVDPAKSLSNLIMEALASFAYTGDPSTPELGHWPQLSFPCASSHEGAEGSAAADAGSGEVNRPLPEAPAGMEHMNFEHGRVGRVAHGWEETRIWCRHALRLPEVRPMVRTMARSLFGDELLGKEEKHQQEQEQSQIKEEQQPSPKNSASAAEAPGPPPPKSPKISR